MRLIAGTALIAPYLAALSLAASYGESALAFAVIASTLSAVVGLCVIEYKGVSDAGG